MSIACLSQPCTSASHGGIWAYVSPSRLNCWLSCPLKLKLQYIDGLRAPTSPSLFLGKVVHAGLEIYYRHRQLGVTMAAGEVLGRLRDALGSIVAEEDMHFESAASEEALRQQAEGLVTAYLQQVPREEPKPLAVEAAIEAPLVDPGSGEDLGIPLLGIMDLVLEGHDGAVIIDFKTSARSSQPPEVVYEVQLSSYAWLFRQVAGQQEGALEIRSLIKTKVPKVEVHRYPARSEVHFRRLFAVIRAYLDDLDAGRFHFRPGFHCSLCDFRDGPCRGWRG